ncbi:EcKinase domain containing protein [Asbolus verrucosus]|uniref:EcKinase domain containing protein n=1 Tax=Asbolus verrucosus TaxID=1661398 RepID=A0A482VM71_ASBVE|nr:EcKinase domain containing protein [Asbolus verrucosus]
MDSAGDFESEVTSWLKTVLKKENVDKFSINLFGNSDKDGYMGDIIFVGVTATTATGLAKKYDLVLKCSKRNQILRETSPVVAAFHNEISFYDTVLPAFTRFQKGKGITDPFDSVPKCYGTLIGDNTEVIVFENLKNVGYSLWDKKKPEDIGDLDVILKGYYESLTDYTRRLGSDSETLYQFDNFLEDWKRFSRFGILMSCMVIKIVSTEADEVIDMAQVADSSEGISKAFLYEVKNKNVLKNRMSYIVKYAVDHDLI